jgi:hypothetical protein
VASACETRERQMIYNVTQGNQKNLQKRDRYSAKARRRGKCSLIAQANSDKNPKPNSCIPKYPRNPLRFPVFAPVRVDKYVVGNNGRQMLKLGYPPGETKTK